MSSIAGNMNRKQRREFAKNINTMDKLKDFESEFIRAERQKVARDMEELYMGKIQKDEEILREKKEDFIDMILTMTAYTIDYKLEPEEGVVAQLMETILLNIDSFRSGHLLPEDYDTIKEEVRKLGFEYKKDASKNQ